ncbi:MULTISPECIES: hypothetical protein [Streptomyces]|uniref:hypothetical protein n=1 Tax=Streptomyces TaxID=1883 RepID=UPI00293026E9|nr:hypothetical protein [Streptomyces sp. NEAU-HV9]
MTAALASAALMTGGANKASAYSAPVSYAVSPGRADALMALATYDDGHGPVGDRSVAAGPRKGSIGTSGHELPRAGDGGTPAPGVAEPWWDHRGKGVAQDVGGWISLAAVLIAAVTALVGGGRRGRDG